jgi:hypothetical protein
MRSHEARRDRFGWDAALLGIGEDHLGQWPLREMLRQMAWIASAFGS